MKERDSERDGKKHVEVFDTDDRVRLCPPTGTVYDIIVRGR